MMLSSRLHKGFTLVELLIVLTILSILAVVIITLINPVTQIQKTNDSRRKSDLFQIQKTLEAYYDDNGRYPTSSAGYRISPGGVDVNWGGTWAAYKTTLPADPSSTGYYVYFSTGQSYWLYTSLERGGSDPQACNSSGTACTNAPSTCGTGSQICNYGVSSSNTRP